MEIILFFILLFILETILTRFHFLFTIVNLISLKDKHQYKTLTIFSPFKIKNIIIYTYIIRIWYHILMTHAILKWKIMSGVFFFFIMIYIVINPRGLHIHWNNCLISLSINQRNTYMWQKNFQGSLVYIVTFFVR